MFVVYIVLRSVVGEIQIVCHGRIFSGQCVDLFHYGKNAIGLAQGAHLHDAAVGAAVEFLGDYKACYLEVAEALFLCLAEQRGVEAVQTALDVSELMAGGYDVVEAVEEPLVNLCKLMDALHGIAFLKGTGYGEYAFVGGSGEGVVQIVEFHRTIAHETVHSLSDHSESFLNHFLECAANGHHLAH